MNGNLYVVLICHIQAMINNCRSCSPVFMNLQSHRSRFHLLCKRSLIGTVSFAEEAKIHRIFLCRLQHFLKIPRSGSTGCRIRSVCRSGSSSNHGCHAGIQSTVNLLRTDKVNMRIDTSRCDDHAFTGKCLCRCANCHSRCHAIHDCRIAGFSDTLDLSIFDSDICLYNSCIVQNQRIGDDKVKITVTALRLYGLSHSITDRLAAAKFDLIPVMGVIFFHLDHKTCICQSHFIPNSRAVHCCIFFSRNLYAHTFRLLFQKSFSACCLQRYLFRCLGYLRTGQVIEPKYPLCSSDLCQLHLLFLTRLKSNRSA